MVELACWLADCVWVGVSAVSRSGVSSEIKSSEFNGERPTFPGEHNVCVCVNGGGLPEGNE